MSHHLTAGLGLDLGRVEPVPDRVVAPAGELAEHGRPDAGPAPPQPSHGPMAPRRAASVATATHAPSGPAPCVLLSFLAPRVLCNPLRCGFPRHCPLLEGALAPGEF